MIEVLLCVVTILIGLFTVATLPSLLLSRFEQSCCDAIEKKDKELEEKKKLNKALRKFIF